jgi:hypothetical protein
VEVTTIQTFPKHPTTITLDRDDDLIVRFCPNETGAGEDLSIRISTLDLPNDGRALGVVFPEDVYMVEEYVGSIGTRPVLIVLKDENQPKRIEIEHWKLKRWEEWK